LLYICLRNLDLKNTLVQMSENIRPKLDNYVRNLKTLPAAE